MYAVALIVLASIALARAGLAAGREKWSTEAPLRCVAVFTKEMVAGRQGETLVTRAETLEVQ